MTPTVRTCPLPAFDWPATLDFLGQRAIVGVEQVWGAAYRRTVRIREHTGRVEITYDADRQALCATLNIPPDLADEAFTRLTRMFDADADCAAISAHLGCDPTLAPLLAARPQIRVIGGWDGFEIACRAILGQQVSIARARALNGRLVQRCGTRLPDDGPLHALFPTPRQVAGANLTDMGMPGARARALQALAEAALSEPDLFTSAGSIEATVARLTAIRGVGPWTAHYVAMRACREPDAFPASDVGLLRGAADASGVRPTPAELQARAEAWRPWRAYAATALWAADAASREG